jgi:hypothetical protein
MAIIPIKETLKMDFNTLIEQLREAHHTMQTRAGAAVNQSHTLRNWLFGY